MADATIDIITEGRGPHHEPFGWHHRPECPRLSRPFARALAEGQEGGRALSERSHV